MRKHPRLDPDALISWDGEGPDLTPIGPSNLDGGDDRLGKERPEPDLFRVQRDRHVVDVSLAVEGDDRVARRAQMATRMGDLMRTRPSLSAVFGDVRGH